MMRTDLVEKSSAILHEYTIDRDRWELELGDALDVKAGLLLAIVGILATLSSGLIELSQSTIHDVQGIAIAMLALSSVAVVMAVLPRTYLLPSLPTKYKQWLDELGGFNSEDPSFDPSRYAQDALIKDRAFAIEHNHAINVVKSRWLFRAFWLMLIALTLDIGCLAFKALV